MKQKIRDYMEKHRMVEEGDHVLCGCSGGADSVALLLLLEELQPEMHFYLEAICVDHGIRGEESQRDADFVKELCREHGILHVIRKADVLDYVETFHIGLEEAARLRRYQEFASRADELRREGFVRVRLALAHHMEDNAETILFQMARGSGLQGMCGMAPVRMMDKTAVIRPLLAVNRGEIEAFLADRGQSFCTDSTNADESYSRNRIRKRILPELLQINSQTVAHMNRMAEQLSDIRDYVEAQILAKEQELAVRQGKIWRIGIPELKAQPPAIRDGVIRNLIIRTAECRKDIAAAHVREVAELLEKQSGKRISLPYGTEAWIEYQELCLASMFPEETEDGIYAEITGDMLKEWKKTGGSHEVPLAGSRSFLRFEVRKWCGNMEEIAKKPYTKFIDYDMIKNGFLARRRSSGDYFVMDAQGRRKKLSDYMIDEKIPARMRDEQMLLAQGSAVVWIVDRRLAENYKVTKDTEYVLTAEHKGGYAYGRHEKA